MIDSIPSPNISIYWKKHVLKFKFDAGTSRGVLKTKDAYFIIIQDSNAVNGVGECCVLKGLSIDDRPEYKQKLEKVCAFLQKNFPESLNDLYGFNNLLDLDHWPSIKIGLETAISDYYGGGQRQIFKNDFLKGKTIPINGLIWMGDKEFMMEQVKQKLNAGYKTIKIKIGAIDFDTELSIIKYIRDNYDSSTISIRVDANGAFDVSTAPAKINALSEYNIHSLEQPIAAGNWDQMAALCKGTSLPIALDEELIGILGIQNKIELLQTIKPQYIILKPSLLGGFRQTDLWIKLAGEMGIGWWVTSALESNIGLNAIAQYTFSKKVQIEQGLGTGQLFKNNLSSPLEIQDGHLHYNPDKSWDLSVLGI